MLYVCACVYVLSLVWPVDFVLVYEEVIGPEADKKDGAFVAKSQKWRRKFMKNVQKTGVQCEEVSRSFSQHSVGPPIIQHRCCFTRCHFSWLMLASD